MKKSIKNMRSPNDMRSVNEMMRIFRSKKGAEMVEAAVAMPIVILAVMLLIRLFAFYMGIADAGAVRHREVLNSMDGYDGVPFRVYSEEYGKEMRRGGLLNMNVSKSISIKAYLINEDAMVRAGGVIE